MGGSAGREEDPARVRVDTPVGVAGCSPMRGPNGGVFVILRTMKLGPIRETPAVKKLRDLHRRVGEASEPELSEALGEEDIEDYPAKLKSNSKAS